MFQYHCLNPIAEKGLGLFDEDYKKTEELEGTDAILVRSAKMHDMELPESVKVIARAGAGVNNIPVKDCAEKGIVVFNTPGANANGVNQQCRTLHPHEFHSATQSMPKKRLSGSKSP